MKNFTKWLASLLAVASTNQLELAQTRINITVLGLDAHAGHLELAIDRSEERIENLRKAVDEERARIKEYEAQIAAANALSNKLDSILNEVAE